MINKILIVIFSLAIIQGCNSSQVSNNSLSDTTLRVNMLGNWNYAIITKNSVCDGRMAQGSIQVSSISNDSSKIGTSLIQGETFTLSSYQTCLLTSVNKISSESYGEQSKQTSNEYLASIKKNSINDNTIKQIYLDSFNNNKIIEVYEFTNGVIMKQILTR